MLLWIIKWVVISIILIALCHNIYIYLQNTFTIPKTRDLIKNPEKRYTEMLSGINAIDDAFSGIRRLKDELIDQEIYDMIKDTDVKVNSRVSILESSSPWFFCALGSHGKTEKPPQWVLVQFDMEKRTPIVHMTTDLTEISEFLLDELPNCEDVTEVDKENYPNWRRIFISS